MKERGYRGAKYIGRILLQTIKRFERTERRKEAAALTYTTLFALVPVLTVTYSILSAIPTMQEWGQDANQELLSYVLPQGSDEITGYLHQFSQQARKLTGVGIVFLFITCLMLLQTIEMQFNRIWNVESSRSKVQKFLRYWAVLSLGPLLFGAAITTSSIFASMPLWNEDPPFFISLIGRAIPWLLSIAAITMVYIMVPNCKVPILHALSAATVISTIFELGKFAFSQTLGLFPSYQLIYGAFAAVPLFLLWIYVSWMLLLLGAELSYGFSHYRETDEGHRSLQDRVRLSAFLMKTMSGGKPMSEANVRKKVGDIDAGNVTSLLMEFRDKGWVILSNDGAWAWVRDPDTISLGEFFEGQQLNDLTSAISRRYQSSLSSLIEWQTLWQETSKEALNMPLSKIIPSNVAQLVDSEEEDESSEEDESDTLKTT
ncbi:MAG: YihY family inner membrane protein [Oleibacter sp.]|nr:YihY family inner membrane protein [Thalassolituus sp.]